MFRRATDVDLIGLRDLERESNEAALAHVFPPELYPFPGDAVLARWRLVLDDPEVAVLVLDDPDAEGLLGFVAYDDFSLRHLAVRPSRWGAGLGSMFIGVALRGMEARGSTDAFLWCLEDNDRARRLYEHHGWRPTNETRDGPWPPHPGEMRYDRAIGQGGQAFCHSPIRFPSGSLK